MFQWLKNWWSSFIDNPRKRKYDLKKKVHNLVKLYQENSEYITEGNGFGNNSFCYKLYDKKYMLVLLPFAFVTDIERTYWNQEIYLVTNLSEYKKRLGWHVNNSVYDNPKENIVSHLRYGDYTPWVEKEFDFFLEDEVRISLLEFIVSAHNKMNSIAEREKDIKRRRRIEDKRKKTNKIKSLIAESDIVLENKLYVKCPKCTEKMILKNNEAHATCSSCDSDIVIIDHEENNIEAVELFPDVKY